MVINFKNVIFDSVSFFVISLSGVVELTNAVLFITSVTLKQEQVLLPRHFPKVSPSLDPSLIFISEAEPQRSEFVHDTFISGLVWHSQ